MTMNEQYSKLAAQLGDVEFKLLKLNAAKTSLIAQIEQLNKMAEAANEKAQLAEKLTKAQIGTKNEEKSSPNNATRGPSST